MLGWYVDGYDVDLPSGKTFTWPTEDQAAHCDELTHDYLDKFTFSNPADLSMLDSVVSGQTLLWTWDRWMAFGTDEEDQPIDLRHVSGVAMKRSLEVRQLMTALGMDNASRKRHSGDGSLPQFIERITTAAVQQDIHRVKQLDKALELANQLRTIITLHRNSDEEERRLTKSTAADIIEWIAEVFEPEMQAIDDYFQVNVHSTWAGQL